MHEEEDLDYTQKRRRHCTMLGRPLTYQASSSCLGAVPESCQTPSGLLKDRHGPDQTGAVSRRLEQLIVIFHQSSGPKLGLPQSVNCANSKVFFRPGVVDVTRQGTVRNPSQAMTAED